MDPSEHTRVCPVRSIGRTPTNSRKSKRTLTSRQSTGTRQVLTRKSKLRSCGQKEITNRPKHYSRRLEDGARAPNKSWLCPRELRKVSRTRRGWKVVHRRPSKQ